MKKVLLGLLSVIFAGQVSFAQPVSDIAVIPMGITINSIMRLNVTSGGNIEFVFNRISDVTTGILYAAGYETNFTVASSVNWGVNMSVDAANFVNESGDIMTLAVIDYTVTTAAPNTTAVGAVIGLIQTPPDILTWAGIIGADNIGPASTNTCRIQWQCGEVVAGTTVAGYPAGRYTANIILALIPN